MKEFNRFKCRYKIETKIRKDTNKYEQAAIEIEICGEVIELSSVNKKSLFSEYLNNSITSRDSRGKCALRSIVKHIDILSNERSDLVGKTIYDSERDTFYTIMSNVVFDGSDFVSGKIVLICNDGSPNCPIKDYIHTIKQCACTNKIRFAPVTGKRSLVVELDFAKVEYRGRPSDRVQKTYDGPCSRNCFKFKNYDNQRGYSPDKAGVFYVVHWKKADHEFLKYGITNIGESRITHQTNKTDYTPTILYFPEFTDGNIAAELERECDKRRNELYGCRGVVSKDDFPDGYTETMNVDQYDWINDLVFENTMCRLKPLLNNYVK